MHGDDPERDEVEDVPTAGHADRSASTALLVAFLILFCMFFAFLLVSVLSRRSAERPAQVMMQAPVMIQMTPTAPEPECGCDAMVTPTPAEPNQVQVEIQSSQSLTDAAQQHMVDAEQEMTRAQAELDARAKALDNNLVPMQQWP